MPRVFCALIFCPLLLAGCGDDPDRNRCGSTSSAIGFTETTDLGFSAGDAFDRALGTQRCTWWWLDDEAYSTPTPVEVTLRSTNDKATFVAGQALGRDAANFECPSSIRADMTLDVQLEDDSLNRDFGLKFSISDANAARSVLDVTNKDLQAYDAREHWYDGQMIRRELIIRVDQGKLSGELREISHPPPNGEEMAFHDITAAKFSCD